MEQKNKTRGPNYSSDEKCILINIIAKYKNIIENKKTDATTWKEKENTWKKITSEFNSQCCGNYRSTESLKKYYENQKKMLRKNVVENKKKMQQTGGGTCTPRQDKNEDILLSLISNKTVYGLENMYDSDANCAAAVHEIVEENITSNNEILEESIGMDHQNVLCTEHITVQEEVEHSENDIVIDWGDYKATHLKTPLSKNLKRVTGNSDWTNRRRPILKVMNTTNLSEQYSDLAKVKLEMARIQLTILKEELEMKRKEYELRIKNFELDILLKEQKLNKNP
ncbi:apontic [Holotrichia oblita]|uniref:Apontic n=1 Tax=Holotrichia oblita TaxID=644536 RepID=A0ACB9SJB6_HOLOL|nr:apontic [Holotrichia oblita]